MREGGCWAQGAEQTRLPRPGWAEWPGERWTGSWHIHKTLGHPPLPKLSVILCSGGSLTHGVEERKPNRGSSLRPSLYSWFSTLVCLVLGCWVNETLTADSKVLFVCSDPHSWRRMLYFAMIMSLCSLAVEVWEQGGSYVHTALHMCPHTPGSGHQTPS